VENCVGGGWGLVVENEKDSREVVGDFKKESNLGIRKICISASFTN